MSEDELNLTPRKTYTFTIDERKLLLRLVNMHYDVVNNKKVDSSSTHLKNQAWEAINKDYMEHTSLVRFPRTVQQLKRCWENMKCKAKRGDPLSVKLLKWGDNQYRISHNGSNPITSDNDTDSLDFNDEDCLYESNKVKEEAQNTEEVNQETNKQQTNVNQDINSCIHCQCDKNERNAKLQFIALQKEQSEELHNLNLQIKREKLKRERELHKIAIHEMTLRVENERRRAEILEKELGS